MGECRQDSRSRSESSRLALLDEASRACRAGGRRVADIRGRRGGCRCGLLQEHSRRRRGRPQVVADALPFEEHLAFVGLKQAGDDFDGGGFAGAVGADVADDLAGLETEADVLDGGNAAIAFGERFDFKHGVTSTDPM